MKSIKSIYDIALKYTLQKCIISKDVMLNRHFFLISIASGFSEVYKETIKLKENCKDVHKRTGFFVLSKSPPSSKKISPVM